MDSKNGLYGSFSGFVAAALLQPLENIKMVIILPPKQLDLSNNFLVNLRTATRYLAQDQGLKSFYKGLVPNVVKTGFSSSIYFTTLRFLETHIQKIGSSSMAASFLNSLLARIASALSSNPLAVVETRFQYAGKERWTGSIWSSLGKIYKIEGVQGFWKGGLATCFKEGGFAGLYYALYSEGKKIGIQPIISGLVSGVIATAVTHPFEIIRTELQTIALTNMGVVTKISIFGQISNLIRSGEALKGVAPRLIKKPLVNTISFAMFQLLQKSNNKEKQ